MTRIRLETEIAAPARMVWDAIHVEYDQAPRWSEMLERAEPLDRDPPGCGDRVRFHLRLPGGHRTQLDLRQTTWQPYRRCAGEFVGGPLRGRWSYDYAEEDGVTLLAYRMDYELGGVLRLAGGLLKGPYEDGIRASMSALKAHLEARVRKERAPRARAAERHRTMRP